MEDLWAFNDETLARVVAASEIPVISAVGHEVDFTLCDYAADCRAPTPSAAAELVVPDKNELLQRVDEMCARMDSAMDKQIYKRRNILSSYEKEIKFLSPMQKFERIKEQLERKTSVLSDTMNGRLERASTKLASLISLLEAMNPLAVLQRGYSMAENENGDVVSSADSLAVGEKVKITFSDGRAYATIDSIEIETEDTELKGDLCI